MPLAYCGQCAYCRRGLQHLCATMGCVGLSHAWGGMAELATVAEYQVVRLPEGVTLPAGGADRADGGRRLRRRAGRRRRRATACWSPAPGRSARSPRSARAPPGPRPSTSRSRTRRAAREPRRSASRRCSTRRPSTSRRSSASRATGSASTWRSSARGTRAASTTAIRSLRRRGTLAQTGLFVGEASVEPMLWALNDLTIVGTWCYWVYDFDRIAAQIAAGDLPVERVVTSTVDAGRRAGRVRAARVGHGRRDQGAGRPMRRELG